MAGAAAASLTLAGMAGAKAPPKPENVLTPDEALARLRVGNRRYADGLARRYDLQAEREALSKGQNPYAAILGCADSRVVPEYTFDAARGDLFVVRIAGNFATEDGIASLEYAVDVLRTPLLVVLGHQGCGAVAATIKAIKDDVPPPGHLSKLVAGIAPAVQAVLDAPGDLLANAIRQNVQLTVDRVRDAAPILSRYAADGKIRVVGGVYALDTGVVELL